jgi:D,D-heptose 1,7-bisphosphate phosphatase
MGKYPTVFIDRDGTINIDPGYISRPEDFELYPFAAQAIEILNSRGWLVVVVTNQSGIGRGYYTEETMNSIHDKMIENLAAQGAKIDGIYFCPHKPDTECDCRKPKTGMFEQAIKDLPIDTTRMVMIGDKYSDMQAGFAAGMRTIMVETGNGEEELALESDKWVRQPDFVVKNLLEAVKVVV